MANSEHGSKVGLTSGSIARYFSGSDGVSGGSNFMSMCELSVKISHASVECRVCGGLGFKEIAADEMKARYRRIARESDPEKLEQLRESLRRESDCVVCRGSGHTTQRRIDMAHAMHPMFTTVRCSRCRGCGETLKPDDASAELGDVCQVCNGSTYIVPVTVKETGSTKHGKMPHSEPSDGDDANSAGEIGGSWADEQELLERGRVGRELDQLRRQDPALSAGMASYFGIEGDKWGPHKWGRAFSLWPHTPAGLQLAAMGAERSLRGHGHMMRALDLIAAEREADSRAGATTDRASVHRRALIKLADSQARQLFERMQGAIRQVEAA